MNIHQRLVVVAETPFSRESNPRVDLVEQAERLALAHMEEPLPISTLCHAFEANVRFARHSTKPTVSRPAGVFGCCDCRQREVRFWPRIASA
jgi:hypothetical protein